MKISSITLRGTLAFFALVLITQAASAQSWTLPQALHRFLEDSPRIQRIKSNIPIAEASLVGSTVWPNPQLAYGGLFLAEGANTGAAQTHQLTANQPLLIFGQPRARKDVATQSLRVARARAQSEIADAVRDLRIGFTRLLAAQMRVERMQAFSADVRKIEFIVSGRQRAGDASRYDALRIQVEQKTIETRVQALMAQQTDERERLALLLGESTPFSSVSGSLEGEKRFPNEQQLLKAAHQQRAFLVWARAEIPFTQSLIDRAKAERIPVPSLMLGGNITRDENSTLVVAGLTLPLPIFDRGQGPIAVSTAQAKAAEQRLKLAEREVRLEVLRATKVLAERRKAIESFDTKIESDLLPLRTMAETAYRDGQRPIVDLLDALRTERDARMLRIDLAEAAKLSEYDLLYAVGL